MKGKLVYQTEPMNTELLEIDLPEEMEPNSILLEVLHSNVCGSDIHVFKGHHPLIKSGGTGHEMVGRIVMMGENVTMDNAGNPVKIGDRIVPVYFVTCNKCSECLEGNHHHCVNAFKYLSRIDIKPYFHSTFSTHYYVHSDQYFFKVPGTVSNYEASSANCALSQVIFGLDKIKMNPRNSIVIQGAGGLGLYACAVAKEKGAKVIIIDSIASRLELAQRFGADHVINMNEFETVEKREKQVKELTNGRGADFGLEVTGVPAAFSEGISLIKPNGKYVVMGNISIGNKVEFDPGLLVRKSIQIIPVNRYLPEYLLRALQFLERNNRIYPFDELLDTAFSLEEAQVALEKSAFKEVTRATLVIHE